MSRLSIWTGTPRRDDTKTIVGITPSGFVVIIDHLAELAPRRSALREQWHLLGRLDLVAAAREVIETKRPNTAKWLREAIMQAHTELEALDLKDRP